LTFLSAPASVPTVNPFRKRWLLLLPVLGLAPLASAAIIGTNPPALPLTAERIAALPTAQQAAWTNYLAISARQLQFDQAFLQAELREHKLKEPVVPPSGRGASSLPLNKPADWYEGTDAVRIADIVLSFQTPTGGWSKNLDLSLHPRAPGEAFAPDNRSRAPTTADFDTPPDTNWSYVGTFDNDATMTEHCAISQRSSPRFRQTAVSHIVKHSCAGSSISRARNIPMAAGRRSGRLKAVITT